MSSEAAVDYIESSPKNNILLDDPQCLEDLKHVKMIMDRFGNKQVHINLEVTEHTGITAPLLKLVVQKYYLEKEKNTIFFRFATGLLSIRSELNNVYCVIEYRKKSAYQILLKSLKVVKNRNLSIQIEIKANETKVIFNLRDLLKAFKWNVDKNLKDWFIGGMKTRFVLTEQNSPDDNNEYEIIYRKHIEDVEGVYETRSDLEKDGSVSRDERSEPDTYSGSRVDMDICKSEEYKRGMRAMQSDCDYEETGSMDSSLSDYLDNWSHMEPAEVASFYAMDKVNSSDMNQDGAAHSLEAEEGMIEAPEA